MWSMVKCECRCMCCCDILEVSCPVNRMYSIYTHTMDYAHNQARVQCLGWVCFLQYVTAAHSSAYTHDHGSHAQPSKIHTCVLTSWTSQVECDNSSSHLIMNHTHQYYPYSWRDPSLQYYSSTSVNTHTHTWPCICTTRHIKSSIYVRNDNGSMPCMLLAP